MLSSYTPPFSLDQTQETWISISLIYCYQFSPEEGALYFLMAFNFEPPTVLLPPTAVWPTWPTACAFHLPSRCQVTWMRSIYPWNLFEGPVCWSLAPTCRTWPQVPCEVPTRWLRPTSSQPLILAISAHCTTWLFSLQHFLWDHLHLPSIPGFLLLRFSAQGACVSPYFLQRGYIGSIAIPKKICQSPTSEPVNVNLFENKIFADVNKL